MSIVLFNSKPFYKFCKNLCDTYELVISIIVIANDEGKYVCKETY